MSFLQPQWFWLFLILPTLGLIPGVRCSLRNYVLRALVLTALILAIARPVLLQETAKPIHVVVLDSSSSTYDIAFNGTRFDTVGHVPRLVAHLLFIVAALHLPGDLNFVKNVS